MEEHRKIRRRHSIEFKSQVIAACCAPGASTAGVALAFGVNANLVRQWRKGRGFQQVSGARSPSGGLTVAPAFVPLTLPPQQAQPAPAPADIRIEVRRSTLQVSVAWPSTAAADCAAWLRELLR